MKQRKVFIAASLLGAGAVGMGAFGAHAFRSMLIGNGRLDTYELAVRYMFYHTLAMLAIGILMEKFPSLKASAILMLSGILIFSGSLFILALTNQPAWGAVTPVGGVLLILGWLNVGWVIYKS